MWDYIFAAAQHNPSLAILRPIKYMGLKFRAFTKKCQFCRHDGNERVLLHRRPTNLYTERGHHRHCGIGAHGAGGYIVYTQDH